MRLPYQRRVIRNKAQYSLDCRTGSNTLPAFSEAHPQELLERMELFCHLCAAALVPETQGRRVNQQRSSAAKSYQWPRPKVSMKARCGSP